MCHRPRPRLILLAALAAVLLLALAHAAPASCSPAAAGSSTCLTNGFFDTILSMVENATANRVSVGAGKTGIGWLIFTPLATLELVWWGGYCKQVCTLSADRRRKLLNPRTFGVTCAGQIWMLAYTSLQASDEGSRISRLAP